MRRQQAFAGGTSATGRGEGWWMLELDSQGKLFPPLVMPGHLITVSSCGERFCLVPPGLEGSPISRRLFDALASGCIPISWQRPLRQLPTACLLGVRCAGVRWRCSQATCSASQNTSGTAPATGSTVC
mmetsp:Transcript_64736/g.121331  ORF Transcript_64736/g.121331 Transcript_64736/m.121331 type:complete len:128 (+) Transcript_64736:332-715(+)